MRSTVRVTYTIPKNIIEKLESISKRHGIFKSNIIAESINTDSRFTDLMCTSLLYDEIPISVSKIKDTIPKTFTIPIEMNTLIGVYAKLLLMKKSHIVGECLLEYMEKVENGDIEL
ncbi:MAG TPA: hypothetical protein PLM93_07960 [Sulfuricurvum sp.]|jgi:predicted DNA-binding protein|nr:hypothetical protein [Sulfuricurvum sp.]HQT37726.1 hypothetical protein [Sulfuricurvum sp.]